MQFSLLLFLVGGKEHIELVLKRE